MRTRGRRGGGRAGSGGWLRAGVAALLAAGAATASQPIRPNVVIVTIDTLRADHVSAYGYERPTTPHFDAFASQGALLESTYAVTPTTLPSHATLFTSLYPDEHGVRENGARLPEDVTTLAEIFARNGYETAAFVSSYVVDGRFGLGQGFERYDDRFDASSASALGVEWEGEERDIPVFDRRAAATTDLALAWLRTRDPERPFLLWVHYFDPHTPYAPPEPYRSRFLREDAGAVEEIVDLYDAEIRYTDEALGRLLAGIDAAAPGAATIVVVTSDHGEGLWDHGWGEHGVFLYEEATRVPLAIRWPGAVPAGRRIAGLAGLVDLAPTLAGLAGLETPEAGFRGVDLSAVLSGEQSIDPDRAVFLQRRDYESERVQFLRVAGPVHAMRWKNWKLIRSPEERGLELYDLAADPGELRNAAGFHLPLTRAMSRRIKDWRDKVGAKARGPDEPIDDETRRLLEELGYAR